MSLHRGTGVSILQLLFLLLLSIAEALELSNPPSTFPGDSLRISWIHSPNDPRDFDLQVGFCGNFNGSLFGQLAIDTFSSSMRHAIIPETLPSGLTLPAACFVRAFDSETKDLIASSPVELTATGSSFTLSTPAAATSSTVSPASTNTAVSVTAVSVAAAAPVLTTIISPNPSVSTVISVRYTSFPSSSIDPLPSASTISTTSELTSSITSETAAAAISTTTANQSSVESGGAKGSIGPLVGEVLGGVFAFLVLLSLLIVCCIWRRRRHRRQLRNKYPFVPDGTYTQQEELGAAVPSTQNPQLSLQLSRQSMDPVAMVQMVDLEGNSVANPRAETGRGTGLERTALVNTVSGSNDGTRNSGYDVEELKREGSPQAI